MPSVVQQSVEQYLRCLDRLLPGRVVGFYVVGSTAQGAYLPGRSDIDYVAVLRERGGDDLFRRLRMLHLLGGAAGALDAVRAGQGVRTGSRNGIFVAAQDLTRPASEIAPLASIVGLNFQRGGHRVNPVDWKLFAEEGLAVRGPAPATLGLDPEPDRLVAWNRENLESYWRPWARRLTQAPWPCLVRSGYSASWHVAWGALGAPRLHHTIATGEAVSKEAAGELALDVFPARWHPLIRHALAYRRGEPVRLPVREVDARLRETAAFVLAVIESAHELGRSPA